MTLLCPDCLKPLAPLAHFGVTLDSCPMCAGIWFDQGELGRLQHAGGQALIQIDESVVPEIHRKEEPSRRDCPSCLKPLDRFHYLYNSPIELDACGECGGFWVEDRELQKIQEWLAGESSRLNAVQSDRAEEAFALANYQIHHDQFMQRQENLRGFITLLGRHRPFGRRLGF